MRWVPTFHDDVGVLLGRPLLRDEAPCLLPALQPGPEGREGWARLSPCTPPPGGSSVGAPQTARGVCSRPGHPSPRLWESLGRSDLAPEIAQTPPPFLPAPPVGPPPRDPGQTTASGVRPLPYCTTAGGQAVRIGVPGTSWGLQIMRRRGPAHLSETGPLLTG